MTISQQLHFRYPDRLLVSPATGHADTEWFDQFWAECALLGCRFDYLATHFYDARSAQNTIKVSKLLGLAYKTQDLNFRS